MRGGGVMGTAAGARDADSRFPALYSPGWRPIAARGFPARRRHRRGHRGPNRQAVIDRRGQPSVLVRINILPLNTVGQRRAGLMLFHSATERRSAPRMLLEGRDRTDESLRFERSSEPVSATWPRFPKPNGAPRDELLTGERAYADTMTAAQEGLLADVSHDLRSLLDGLAVSAALLIADAPSGADGDKIRKHAAASQRAVARMTRLVSDLLDTASIEAGRLMIAPEPVDVGKLVSDTVEAFTSIARASDIALDAALPAPPLSATLDGQRIQQVLSNLVGNAIKFTPAGGRCRSELERWPIGSISW